MAVSNVTSAPSRATPNPRDLPASTLARHVPHLDVLALAGRGSFGEVWLVKDRESGRLHALKQVRSDCPSPAAARQLLWNEAEVGRRVKSDFVVRVGEASLQSHPPYVLLEWLSGETLEARLARDGKLPCSLALWIARQCAQGLYDLLKAGLTHGDVKPSNIFLCRSGVAKLIDLGFARPDKRILDELADSSRTLSGTPDYLAPEALVPSEYNGVAKDLYSLGVTLFRMLAGVLPFQGETVGEIVRQQRQSRPPRLRTITPGIPSAVENLVDRLLAKQPLRRSSGLRELVNELVALELQTIEDE
jgi:eukaryotic-like serine/threonine-protein kinase